MSYTTADEKIFLDGIGSYYVGSFGKIEGETEGERKVRLLLRYIDSMEGRKVWDGISETAIIDYAQRLLKELGVPMNDKLNSDAERDIQLSRPESG